MSRVAGLKRMEQCFEDTNVSGTRMELLEALPMVVVFWAKMNCGAPLFQVDEGNLVSNPQGSGNANAGGGAGCAGGAAGAGGGAGAAGAAGAAGGAAGKETGGVDMMMQLSIHGCIVLKVCGYIPHAACKCFGGRQSRKIKKHPRQR